MRKELYLKLCERLRLVDGGAIRHIDLWNQNVQFIEQEESFPMPAVFVEFGPIEWGAWAQGVEYRAEPLVHLHVVTEWKGSAAHGSTQQKESLEVFDLLRHIHEQLTGLTGDEFTALDLVSSQTNHNHEDIVENIETYRCVAVRRLCDRG